MCRSYAVPVLTSVDFDCRDRVVPEMVVPEMVVLENIWAEVRLLDLVAALIVALMAIGPVIAKLETGRTSAIDVEKEAI